MTQIRVVGLFFGLFSVIQNKRWLGFGERMNKGYIVTIDHTAVIYVMIAIAYLALALLH